MMRIISAKKPVIIITLFIVIALMVSCSSPQKDSITEQYKYDDEGRLVCRIAPDGSKTTFKYNEQGVPTEVRYPGSRVRYGYDENGNRIWMKDKTGTTEYYYDVFDCLVGVIWKHSPWRLIIYEYDPRGYLIYEAILNPQMMEQEQKYRDILADFRRKSADRVQHWKERELQFQQMMQQIKQENVIRRQQWTDYEVKYQHNILGNITSIDTKWGSIKYFYHPDKGQVERRLPNGITTRFTYSPNGLLNSLRHENNIGQPIAEYQYDYNAAGKVINVHELTPQGLRTTGYTWDTRGYLKELHLPDGNKIKYDYDVMGNRILKEDATGTLQYNYDKFGRLIQAGNLRYEWDRNGNLIYQMEKQSKTRIRYDGRNLLTLIRIPDATIRYDWDGDGNIISKRMGKDITHYLSDPLAPSGFTLAELNKTGKLAASYLYGDALLGQRDMNGQTRYFLEDGFNSIRHITDMNGKIVGQQDYTSFAEPIAMKGDIAGIFRMAGERFLPEIKTYAIGGRLYEPKLGRYIIPDPLPGYMGRFDSFNKYAHGCNASGIFTEPRCNQTKKWKPLGIWGIELPDLRVGQPLNPVEWTLTNLQKDALTFFAGKVWGPTGGFVTRSLLATVEPWSKQTGRIAGDGPWWTWEDIESFSKAGLAVIGGTQWGPPGKYGMLLAGEATANVARFYGTRMDRPYWWWSPMKWMPQEEYLQRLEEKSKWRAPVATEADRAKFKDDLRKPFKGPDWPDGGGGGGFNDPFKSVENQLGGIELATTGEFVGNLGNITGAVYDPEKQCLILLGDKNLSVPSVKAEDLAIALTSVFGPVPQDPQFSLDPADPRNPKGDWLKAVYIPEKVIATTSFGKAMFEADWLLKQYSFGVSIDGNGKLQDRKSSVSGFKSTADLSLEQKDQEYGKEKWARFWIVSDNMRLIQSDNSIYFDVAKMRVKAKKQVIDPSSVTGLRDVDTEDDPVATKFANLFTELYDEIAKESPEFEHVRQLAKAVALAKWLKKEGIPVDMDWVFKYANQRIETVDKITALSVQWQKQNQMPYSVGGQKGIQTTIHQLYLFGGVDLTVNPRYVSDDGRAHGLQEAISSKLREKNAGPLFTVEYNGNTLLASVLPITRSGQDVWENSPSIEVNGITYQFNNQKQVIKSVDKIGNITEYSYGSDDKLKTVKISNRNGWKINGERNGNGSLWTALNPRGNTFKYMYSNSGYLEEIEVDGHTLATYEFDQKQREVTIRYDGYTEKITHDENSNIREYEIQTKSGSPTSLPETEKVIFDYDKFGNLTKTTGVGMSSVNISYMEDGVRPAMVTTPQAEIRYSYHSDGRVKEITHSSGISANYVYDGEQLTKLEVDCQGIQAEYRFNKDGIAQSRDLLGGVANYGYTNGILSSVKLAEYGEANYVYDDQNRLQEICFPNGSQIEYQYREGKIRGKKVIDSQWQEVTVVTHPAPTHKQ